MLELNSKTRGVSYLGQCQNSPLDWQTELKCVLERQNLKKYITKEIQRPHRDQNNNERCEFIGKDADVCKRMREMREKAAQWDILASFGRGPFQRTWIYGLVTGGTFGLFCFPIINQIL